MKIKTIKLEDRLKEGKTPTSLIDKIIMASLIIGQIFFNTFLPFLFGFYLYATKNLIFFGLVLVLLFFNIQIEYKKDGDINIKVIRNV